ncbi:MAG TPA: SRPBCC domain-containing protein [Allosphingosinicella sp.]|jgi:uncharacterized protein YndB with AHSA1/START domain
MTTDTAVVEITRRYDAATEVLFDAWLDPESVRHWLFATPDGVMERVEIEPRVGGRFRIEERRGTDLAEHYGEYVEIDRPRRLAFDFWTNFSAERTRITVAIVPDGDGSRMTLTHEGVWADYEDRTRQGWTMILEGLARTVEG